MWKTVTFQNMFISNTKLVLCSPSPFMVLTELQGKEICQYVFDLGMCRMALLCTGVYMLIELY